MSEKVIVAGGRDITDRQLVFDAIDNSGFTPREIVSGGADGVDSLGEEWAEEHGIDVSVFEAEWDRLGQRAGPERNEKMANYADAAVIVWDGTSAGTRSMVEKALTKRLDVHVEPVDYDGVVLNHLSEEELLEKLPELKRIEDVWIRSKVINAMLEGYPDYNWKTSAARNHHPPDERGEHGQWLHLKRVYAVYEEIARTFHEQGKLSKRQIELGKAGVFLHDMYKYGIPPKAHKGRYGNHDTLAAEYVRQFTNLPEEVARACDTHAGAWGNETTPETALEQAVHLADYFPSRDATNQGVFDPADEIEEASDMLIEKED